MSELPRNNRTACLTSSGRCRVVTAIIRRGSDGHLLMLQRSDSMKEYAGCWHFISGSLEVRDLGRCLERARLEILEETGISELQLVCHGRPLRVEGKLLIHPVLYNVAESQSAVVLNCENQAYQWIAPEDIDAIENTVPRLRQTFERTQAPNLFPIKARDLIRKLEVDRVMHPTELARFTSQCFDVYASSKEERQIRMKDFLDFAWAVAISRPLMASVSNAVLSIIKHIDGERSSRIIWPHVIHESLNQLNASLEEEAEKMASHGVNLLEETLKQLHVHHVGLRVLTHSDSPTIRDVLKRFHSKSSTNLANVIICESRPRYQGQDLAAALCASGIACTLITDVQMVLFACNADIALVDAQAVRASKSGIDIVGKVGMYALALAARERSIPIHVFAGLSKIHHGLTPFELEELPTHELTDGYRTKITSNLLSVRHVNYEAVPSRLLTSIITNTGTVPGDALWPISAETRRTLEEIFL